MQANSALDRAKKSFLKQLTDNISANEKLSAEEDIKEKDQTADQTEQANDLFKNSLKNQTYPQYLDYDPPTDEELLSYVKKTLEAKRTDEIDQATEANTNSKNSVYKAINDQIASAENRKEQSKSNYGAAIKNVEDQALKRGIARSSAAVNSVAQLENGLAGSLNSIDKEREAAVKNLNDEIAALESDLVKTIAKIDSKYADAVDTRLKELIDERDEKINEIIKYNNSLARTEASQNSSGDEIANNDLSKISNVVSYYSNFADPMEALNDFIETSYYKSYLGEYYDTVYQMLLNRVNLSKNHS